MKKGFTLVELSVVLVIIGLLIGGILVAQSMIQTTKLNKAISQIQQFDIAVSNFRSKYNQMPGDSNLFSLPGNNNSTLEDFRWCCGGFYGDGGGGNEINNFWRHLQMAGFGDKVFAYNLVNPPIFDIDSQTPNSPKISLDINAGVMPMACNIGSPLLWCYVIGSFQGGAFGNPIAVQIYDTAPALKPATMQALDAKIDDGKPNSGYVRASITTGTCFSGSAYLPANTGTVCNTYIQMLLQTGN